MRHPATSPCPESETRFWCERVTLGSRVEEVAHHSAGNPAEAIRHIRTAVRSTAAMLPPKERERALGWANGAHLGALAALHRGEPCGFSLSLRSAWLEWTAHPYVVLHPAGRTQLPLVRAELSYRVLHRPSGGTPTTEHLAQRPSAEP